MFTTKKDVDKHVRTGFAKLRSENEKNLRGYSVAKLYAKIGEHQSALHYVSTYLAIKDDAAPAHRLAGQCYERLKRPDKAIASYQRSLQLDPKQTDLLIDVCKLLLAATADNNNSSSDATALGKPGTLRFWCDLADAQRVQHEAVVQLKMKLLRRDTFTPQQVDEMLQREIAAQPHSVTLRIQLVRHMLDQRRLDEAFKYATELEQRQLEPFAHSLDWYASVAQVIAQLDVRDCTHSWPYWLLAVSTAERQLFLTLCAADRRSYAPTTQLNECATLLFHLDQTLDRAAKAVGTLAPSADLAAAFVQHYGGQLCLHAATLVYRREQLQKTHWRETQRVALPLLLLAHNAGAAAASALGRQHNNNQQTEPVRQLLRQWQREAAFRSVQAGRTLLAHVDAARQQCTVMANIRKICTAEKTGMCATNAELLAQVRQYCADNEWRRNAFRALYNGLGAEQIGQHSSSYLVQAPALAEPTYELPAAEQLDADAQTAQWLRPSDLALHVYLAVGGASATSPVTLADFRAAVFDGLNVTTANLVNCGAETLSQLDVDAVLWATAVQTQQRLAGERACEQQSGGVSTPNGGASGGSAGAAILQRPFANVAAQLATEEQADWWSAAYRVYKNLSTPDTNLAEVRATLQHGLEAVRGVGAPKMDLMICLRLGQIFAARATATAKPSDRQPLDARADALFKFGLHMVRLRANGTLGDFRPLFRYQVGTGGGTYETESAVNAAAEEAVTYVASRYFQSQSYQDCIDELTGIQLPFATYFVAEAYRKLEQNAGATTPRKSRRVYVEKARDSLQQTLELLDYPHVDKNHALRAIVHDDMRAVQQQLTKTNPANVSIGGDLSFTNGGGGSGADDYHNDSISSLGGRNRRQVADLSAPRVDELKNLMTKMMEQLTLVQDDMMAVRTRLGNIEEQLNRKPEPTAAAAATSTIAAASNNPLEDYFLEEELNQQQAFAHNSPYGQFGAIPRHSAAYPNMMPNAAAMMNPYQQQQQQQQLYNVYQQMGYQAAMSGGRNPMMPPVGGVPGQYVDPSMGGAYGMTPSPQNSNILGLLQSQALPFTPPNMQQQPQQTPLSVQPPQQTQPIQVPPTALYMPPQQQQPQQSLPVQQPPQHVQPPPPQQLPPQSQSQQPQAAVVSAPSVVKPWNPALNNAPVEKAPPVNVVITSSDPLPVLLQSSKTNTATTTAAQPMLSVTIPSHHIKNNATTEPAPITTAAPAAAPAVAAPMFGGFVQTPSSLTKKADDKPKAALFGGLTFSSAPKTDEKNATPTVTSTAKQADKTNTPAKTSPFANFTFGAASTPNTTNVFGSISTGTKAFGAFGSGAGTGTTAAPAPATGGGLFSSLTATKSVASAPKLSTTPQKPTDTNNTSATNADAAATDAAAAEAEDDYVPTAHFEPVIALPDLVETKTGEEEEHIRFEHRAKLLRYVKETKEWKERGIGQMKVLVNKVDPSKVRLLMRREQVLKLCCNQLLAKDTKFNALGTAGTSMTWFGQDYSENELQVELLAIRFKTADTCKQFHEAVLQAQRDMGAAPADATPAAEPTKAATSSSSNVVPSKAPAAGGLGFGSQFKPASGSWECTQCYVTNKAGTEKCLACNGPAPGAQAKPKSVAAVQPPAVAPGAGFGGLFKPKTGSWECGACYISNTADVVHCVACDSPKDDTVAPKPKTHALLATSADAPKFSFGVPMAAASPAASAATNAAPAAAAPPPAASGGAFSFGTFTANTNTNTIFGNVAATTSTPAGGVKPVFGFSLNGPQSSPANATAKAAAEKPAPLPIVDVKLAQKEAFSFVFKPKSPTKAKSPLKNFAAGTEDVSDDDADNIEEENNTYFTPVIALPDKVDVVTGEEGELVLYAHRAKLYRFTDSEWKERGLGEVKILRHKQNGKLRVVMRREQVHKICLNHALTEDIEYQPKDDKSWHFVANDYTEGAVELLQFCLRFKNAEIANAFKTAAADALSGKLTTAIDDAADSSSSAAVSNVSDEDKRLAEQLKLSVAFFGYRDAPPCAGCRGCRSDEFVFPVYKDVNLDHVDANPLPLHQPVRQTTAAENQISKTMLKQSSFTFVTPPKAAAAAPAAADTPKPFGGSLFGDQSFTTSAAGKTPSIFGDAKAPATSAPLFGSSIFGGVAGSDAAPKPLPAKSFSFGSPFGGPSPFQVTAITGTATPTTQTAATAFGGTPSSSSSTFTFSLPAASSSTDAKDVKEPAAAQPFSFNMALSAAATKPSEPEKSTVEAPAATQSLFGGAAIFKPAEKDTSAGNIFSTVSSSSVAGESGTGGTNNSLVFGSIGGGGGSIFGGFGKAAADSTTTAASANATVPFKDSGLSFASLATTMSAAAAATKTTADKSAGGFFGLSKKDDFTSFQRASEENGGGGGGGGDDSTGGEDPNYDPHYDSIIALPDEIEVRTGEEDEEKVFGERAKLYRYDTTNREWKERGIGELKILRHIANGTYRILLRREQVFKLVLNHALTLDLSITPMQSSDKAYCWATNNYADDAAGVTEQLSVRFKNAEIGSQFDEAVKQCMAQLRLRPQAD